MEALDLPGPATSGSIAIPAALRRASRPRLVAAHVPPTPARIGPYYVLRRLLLSPDAVLYRAVDASGARVVLKAPAAEAGWAADARLRREGELIERLDHPGIVRLLDHGVDESGRAWLAMPDLQGGDFRMLLNRLGAAPLRRRRAALRSELLPLFLAACSAVAEAHAQGICHLDLKPRHLMLDASGQPVVVDWGIAREPTSPPGRAGLLLGTPGYMAPEQCGGHEHGDLRSDVWSLGATLYELLTFRRAVPAGDVDRMLALTCGRLPRRPDEVAAGLDVPDAVSAVCMQALALDPADRPADARVLRQAVEVAFVS